MGKSIVGEKIVLLSYVDTCKQLNTFLGGALMLSVENSVTYIVRSDVLIHLPF